LGDRQERPGGMRITASKENVIDRLVAKLRTTACPAVSTRFTDASYAEMTTVSVDDTVLRA